MLRPVGSKDLKRLVRLRVLVRGSTERLAARKQHWNTSWRPCPFEFYFYFYVFFVCLFLGPIGFNQDHDCGPVSEAIYQGLESSSVGDPWLNTASFSQYKPTVPYL